MSASRKKDELKPKSKTLQIPMAVRADSDEGRALIAARLDKLRGKWKRSLQKPLGGQKQRNLLEELQEVERMAAKYLK